MSDDLEFIVIDDIPEYIFCIGDDEENERVIALSGKDGAFKYEKVAELPTTGEDGVLYLVPKSHTTQTASGNPISVNITDSAGKIESLKLDGDTYQQSYTGKNLYMDTQTYTNTSVNPQGQVFDSTNSARSSKNPVKANTEYHISYTTSNSTYANVFVFYSEGDFVSRIYNGVDGSNTFTTPASCDSVEVVFYNTNGIDLTQSIENYLTNIQLEQGSSATTYEPYVGGQASPNPSYPQQVQTVTGVQTVSINGTDYSIDLGSLELCKLSTYQDFIYKDGDDWKVHKATGKTTLTGSEEWTRATTGTTGVYRFWTAVTDIQQEIDAVGYSNRLIKATGDTWSYDGISGSNSNRRIYIRYDSIIGTMTVGQLRTWLSTNNITAYYNLATATDTTITDTTLIAQLEAVRMASLETGTNTISNTATGTNLAGDLEIGYYGYDPLNKYNKYFWLDVDGAYEQL